MVPQPLPIQCCSTVCSELWFVLNGSPTSTHCLLQAGNLGAVFRMLFLKDTFQHWDGKDLKINPLCLFAIICVDYYLF